MQRERITSIKSPTPAQTAQNEWLIPASLILLTLIPVLGGIVRLIGLAGGAEVTPANARFFAMPLPVIVHIVSASVFCVLGAFQFMPSFRRRRPNWHRAAGRVVAVCGVAAASSGPWMTQFYPLHALHLQMDILHVFRLLIGSAMLVSVLLSIRAVLNRDISGHRAWMIRGLRHRSGRGNAGLDRADLGAALRASERAEPGSATDRRLGRQSGRRRVAHSQEGCRSLPPRRVLGGLNTAWFAVRRRVRQLAAPSSLAPVMHR